MSEQDKKEHPSGLTGYDRFIELGQGEHHCSIVRRSDRGDDPGSTFVVDAPQEDINVLMTGLAMIVDDPEKLKIRSEASDDAKKRAHDLALSLFELLNRRYRRQHDHTWHCLGVSEIPEGCSDPAAVLVADAFQNECAGAIEVDDEETQTKMTVRGGGFTIIDT